MVAKFKNKGDVQSCIYYRGIKLMNHTMKIFGKTSRSDVKERSIDL